MARFRYETGAYIVIDNERYRILGKAADNAWQLLNVRTNLVASKTADELNRMYISGNLAGDIPSDDSIRGRQSTIRPALSDLNEKARRRVITRKAIIDAVTRSTAYGTLNSPITKDGRVSSPLIEAIAKACADFGIDPPITPRTFYRWKCLLTRSDDALALQGRFNATRNKRIHPRVRQIAMEEMSRALEEAADKKVIGRSPSASMREIRKRIAARVRVENSRETGEILAEPSRSICYRWWGEYPAYARDIAKHGKTRARAMYRAAHGHEPREGPLELVEYDETRLPIFLYDEALRIPLGRPWLSWYVDVHSRMPLGFYLGYEPPGDLTITSALRHACLPKSYVADEYPDIRNQWLARGIPNLLVFDNGLSQHGNSIRDVTFTLDCHIDFTPSRTPWFKSAVEGSFRVLNTLLLQDMPGFVFPGIDRFDYSPTENGCLGMRHFLALFHHWLIDIYCQKPWGYERKSPAERWEYGTESWEPDLLAHATDLDAVFGIVRQATLDHRGVVFEGIRYFSDDLQALRYQGGSNHKVRIKINPSNLERVYIWLARDQAWISVSAVPHMRQEASRSLHCHQVVRRYAREFLQRDDSEALKEAEWELQRLISEALPVSLSIRGNSLAARFLGHGTQNIFGNQSADGRLGHLTGPYKGASLNPHLNSVSEGISESHANDAGDQKERRLRIPKLTVEDALGSQDESK